MADERAAKVFPEGLFFSADPPVAADLFGRPPRGGGRALRAFLDESGDLLRIVRETSCPVERARAIRRLRLMASVVGAGAFGAAASAVSGFAPDDDGDAHLDAVARLHAAAAETRAAVAALVARAEAR